MRGEILKSLYVDIVTLVSMLWSRRQGQWHLPQGICQLQEPFIGMASLPGLKVAKCPIYKHSLGQTHLRYSWLQSSSLEGPDRPLSLLESGRMSPGPWNHLEKRMTEVEEQVSLPEAMAVPHAVLEFQQVQYLLVPLVQVRKKMKPLDD